MIRLGQLAVARSGDKGNHANLGVVARSAECYAVLCQELTVERVEGFFAGLPTTGVRRFELPRVLALNFLLENALAGGASQSLRIDTQGKLLGTALMDMELTGDALPPGALPPFEPGESRHAAGDP